MHQTVWYFYCLFFIYYDMQEITTRLYDECDFQSLCSLCQGVTEYYSIGRIPDAREMESYVRDYVLGPDSDVKVMMAFDGDRGIGLASFSIMYPSPNLKGQLYLKELYVDVAYRGKGAGKALMKAVARYALERNCSRMDWSAEKTNPSALDFYEAIGAKALDVKVYYRISDADLKTFAGENTPNDN